MNLLDGLDYYKADSGWWDFTLTLEESAVEIVKLISQHGDRPTPSARAAAYALLIEIEKWKAMCLGEQMGNAGRNSEQAVWNAFRMALEALGTHNDHDAILSIMSLKGFGLYQDEETGLRRAKRATAVLRFLNAFEWGVVDWRTIAMLDNLKKASGKVDEALALAKKIQHANLAQLKDALDVVNEDWACEVNREYRAMRSAPFSRAADVDMALFGLSMMAWRFKASAQVP